jgi:ABC-2 type transport system ATP-binding protein
VIEAKDLTKNYGQHRAVDGVSFRIEPGEIVGLLGPNGSGKTTTMRMLTGFFSPTSGNVSIAGCSVRDDPREARRHIGYLPERVALYPDMTVRGFLSFIAKMRGVSGRVSSHIDDAVDVCGLGEHAHRQIGKLSKGYRQRVGIAQAIIHQPDVLILDEPTVGLDPRQIVEIRNLIQKLAGLATVLLSTHILPEVSATCRRVLILDHGKLIAEDTAEGLTAKTAGRGETLVRVKGPEKGVAKALEQCTDVDGVELLASRPDGAVEFCVSSPQGAMVRPALARVVIDNGWGLEELSPKLLSLEELFVTLLAGAGSGKAQP